jgi:hypothetical protein
VLGVPRYLYRKALDSVAACLRATARRDAVAAFDHELWVWFFAGIVRQRLTDRHRGDARLVARRGFSEGGR